jgi:hypothetical protein
MDHDFAKQMNEMVEKRKQGIAEIRPALLKKLVDAGVNEVDSDYDGYGDSGNVGEVCCLPNTITIPTELEGELEGFIWSVAYHLNPGFEINEGGRGNFNWKLEDDKIDVNHSNFYTSEDSSFHENVLI